MISIKVCVFPVPGKICMGRCEQREKGQGWKTFPGGAIYLVDRVYKPILATPGQT